MSWSCGIVGLPNAGKSTLFKALTLQDVAIESYPFSTIEPNLAVVPLQDYRLRMLAERFGSTKVTPASINVVDVAGLVQGASRGEGLGNRFLGQLREMDLLIQVVASFQQGFSSAEAATNVAVVNLELTLADLDALERRRNKVAAKLKSGDSQAAAEALFIDRLARHLDRGKPARTFMHQPAEQTLMDQLFLLTAKRMIYLVNQAEGEPPEAVPPTLAELALAEGCAVLGLCAHLEAELAELPEDERNFFMAEYKLAEPGVSRLLDECYRRLNLITFYTIKGTEARAWIVPEGVKAVEAAEKVHTDMARGFISAEVIAWGLLEAAGALTEAREKGLTRTEGRDYRVRDGEVLFFRFRV
jgi:ribosome-binding ATPase